jgi:hypothetical protein
MKARTFFGGDLRGAVIFLVAMSVVAAPSVARADQVDRLIDQGISLRLQGNLEGALDLFTRAHALAPTARTLAQMGLAEGALHRWIASENHLAAALASHDTPWIEVPRNREALEQALATVRSHVGTLKVVGPAGARVDVDDREVARLPLTSPLRLAEGPAHVTATAPGYGATRVVVTIVGSAEQTVVVPLVPLPQAAPAALRLDEPAPAARWKTWTGFGLLGVSAGAIATGAVWVVLDGHPSCPANQVTRCELAYDTKLQGWLTIGAGIAAGTAGGILLWSARQAPATVAAGPGSIAFTGRF